MKKYADCLIFPQKVGFICKAGKGTHLEETWQGVISFLWNFGSHYEMQIQSRSSITVLFGKTSRGYFASIPDWQAGCYLVDFNDLFWNTEQLSGIIGEIDGITVAKALYTIANKVKL